MLLLLPPRNFEAARVRSAALRVRRETVLGRRRGQLLKAVTARLGGGNRGGCEAAKVRSGGGRCESIAKRCSTT